MGHLLIGLGLLFLARIGRKTFKESRVHGKKRFSRFAVYLGREMKMFRIVCFLLLIYVGILWYQGAVLLFETNTFF